MSLSLSAPSNNGYNIDCFGNSTGSIIASATGGNGNITYSWSNGDTIQNISNLSSGPYSVTKAAAVKLAEFLAITHGDDGIGVSVLCPQGVNTAMAPKQLGDGQTDGIIEPEVLAQCVIDALAKERFHVLPHAEVEDYVRRKGDDIDRWLNGMRHLRRQSS